MGDKNWQEVGDWFLVPSLVPNLHTHPEQFGHPGSSGFGSIREPDLTQTPLFPEEQQRPWLLWGNSGPRHQLRELSWSEHSRWKGRLVCGHISDILWGISEFIGAYLGWIFTPQILLAFPAFRAFIYFFKLVWERERQTDRQRDGPWLGIKPTTLSYWDSALTNRATWPGLIFRTFRNLFPPSHCCDDQPWVHAVKPMSFHLMPYLPLFAPGSGASLFTLYLQRPRKGVIIP